MASCAGLTLALPGTPLARIWILNPRVYKQLAPLDKEVGVLFLLLAAALAGWFKRRVWGWRLAIAIIATQIAPDLVNTFSGHMIEGGHRRRNRQCAAPLAVALGRKGRVRRRRAAKLKAKILVYAFTMRGTAVARTRSAIANRKR